MELGLHLKLSKQISNAFIHSSIHFTNLHRARLSQKNESKTIFLNYHHDSGLTFFKTKYRGDQIQYQSVWHVPNTNPTVKHYIHCKQSNDLSRNKSGLDLATNSYLVPQKSAWQSSTESLSDLHTQTQHKHRGQVPPHTLQPIHSLGIIPPLAATTATWERICCDSAH